jgi:hypothetical protein
MYCKLFSSLYQGTLRGRSHAILVFTNLLAHADQYGVVDKHFKAIADEVGLSIPEVKAALEELESPDPESRSPAEDGRRIVRMDEHRVWGWQIVNYGKYRAIRNEDDRRAQNREAQKRWREKKKSDVDGVSQDKPKSAHETASPSPSSSQGEEVQEKGVSHPRRQPVADNPPDTDIVLSFAKNNPAGVLRTDICMAWMDARSRDGWKTKKDGHIYDFYDWQSDLRSFHRNYIQNEGDRKTRNGSAKPKRPTDCLG